MSAFTCQCLNLGGPNFQLQLKILKELSDRFMPYYQGVIMVSIELQIIAKKCQEIQGVYIFPYIKDVHYYINTFNTLYMILVLKMTNSFQLLPLVTGCSAVPACSTFYLQEGNCATLIDYLKAVQTK